MPNGLHEPQLTAALGDDALAVISGPWDLGEYPLKTVTIQNRSTTTAFAECIIEVSPSADGPWLTENIDSTGLRTLGAGVAGRFQMSQADRYLRVRAQAATLGGGETCPVTVWVDCIG